MKTFKSALITGASSGIGEALALELAGQGIHLALTGQDQSRLDSVAAACREAGAQVLARVVDVRDSETMANFISEADSLAPLDLVIANAGVSAGTGGGDEPPEQGRRITDVNVQGVLNTVDPAIILMRRRKCGQIGLISSLAGFRGFPGAPAYCASKAWVKVWGEGQRGHLLEQGIGVTVVCPGFVTSRMTARNPYRMPFMWTAEKAARVIVRGLAQDKARVAFPFPLYWLVWFLSALPAWMTDALFRRLPKKGL